MNSNIKLVTIFVIIFIILMTLLIFYYFNNKETFQSDAKSIVDYELEDEGGIKISTISGIDNYYLIPNPINMNDNLMMLEFKRTKEEESKLTLLRKKDNLEKDFTLGFYIAHKDITGYLYAGEEETDNTVQLLRGIDNDNKEVLNIKIKNNSTINSEYPNLLQVTYEENTQEIPFRDNVLVTDNSGDGGLTYIVITFKGGGGDFFIPKATINVNSKIYTINMENKQAQTLSMKKFIFGGAVQWKPPQQLVKTTASTSDVTQFNELLGSIALWNRILDKVELCNHFNCNLICFEPDSFKCVGRDEGDCEPDFHKCASKNETECDDASDNCDFTQNMGCKPNNDNGGNPNCVYDAEEEVCLPKQDYGGNVNGCIKDCMTTCDDIIKCQKICVNCDVEGEYWSEEKKLQKCPWLKETKVLDMTVPEAPVIRGFPGDGSILIEWKKPFNGRSKITNYIVLYYEAFSKQKGVKLSISGKSENDINEYELKHLKNKTHYDIVVRAVNSRGIGKPSNIITIAPNGNIIASANRNIFSELEDDLDKEVGKGYMDFRCDLTDYESVGHTLDFYNHEERDIADYIKKIDNQ